MSEQRPYQRCTCCVMDTTDSKITFDEKGVCDFCNDYYNNILPHWKAQLENTDLLMQTAAKIKEDTKGQKYDCIIGMSGGVDSSYLCYIAKEVMGLNPLIYVVDTGWNLDVANENIDRIVNALGLDMYKEVVDWEEMKDLQLAFFKAQVPYQDLPQDHAIFAGLYNYAVKNKIKYVLTGANNATECIRPPIEWVEALNLDGLAIAVGLITNLDGLTIFDVDGVGALLNIHVQTCNGDVTIGLSYAIIFFTCVADEVT